MSIHTVKCFKCANKNLVRIVNLPGKTRFQKMKIWCPECKEPTIVKPSDLEKKPIKEIKEPEITNPSLRRALGMA